jgi:hypothetical protein
MMARRRLKLGWRKVLLRRNLQSTFPKIYRRFRLLALCGCGRYISLEFPDIASGSA